MANKNSVYLLTTHTHTHPAHIHAPFPRAVRSRSATLHNDTMLTPKDMGSVRTTSIA